MRNLKFLFNILVGFFNKGTLLSKMWQLEYYKEGFKNYFIDRKEKRVVLIGENQLAAQGKKNYHYSLKDEKENFVEIFTLGEKTKNLEMLFGPCQAQGKRISPGSLWIGFDKDFLSNWEMDFLRKNNFKIQNRAERIYENIIITRYPASKETVKNYHLLPLRHLETTEIFQQNSKLQIWIKTLTTPLILAIDIILLPINFPYFIYSQIRKFEDRL
jgi:hypothetical protein